MPEPLPPPPTPALWESFAAHPDASIGGDWSPPSFTGGGLTATRWLVDAKSTPLPTDSDGEGVAYTLLSRIGGGGMGEVWVALQQSLQRTVAVKRLKGAGNDPGTHHARLLFHKEALVTAQLNHPNIVPVHDLGEGPNGELLIAMKYVRGTPWHERLATDCATLPMEERLAAHIPILLAVAQAVAFAHSRGIVHRDLKPQQVVVGEYGEVTLMDWGLALCVDRERLDSVPQSTGGQLLPTNESAPAPAGTARYMAPEQLQPTAAGVGYWTDTYLLGATLHSILTGTALRAGVEGSELKEWIRDGRYLPVPKESVPAELAELVERCLRPNARERLQTAEQFVARLQEFLSGSRRRRESEGLTAEARAKLSLPPDGYAASTAALALLERAEALWAGNGAIGPLRDEALARHARAAIKNRDLVLARIQQERIAGASAKAETGVLLATAVREARVRDRVRAGALASTILLLATVAILSVLFTNRLAERTAEAEAANERLEAQLYSSSISLAERLANSGAHQLARERLLATEPERRDIEWSLLYRMAHPELAAADAGTGPVARITHDPERRALLVEGRDGRRAEIGLDAWTVAALPPRPAGPPPLPYTPQGEDPAAATAIAAEPGGRRLALGDANGAVRIHTVGAEQPTVLAGHVGAVTALRWAEDGLLYSTSADSTLRMWDPDAGELRCSVRASDDIQMKGVLNDAAPVPATGVVATAGADGRVRLWVPDSEVPAGELPLHPAGVGALAPIAGTGLLATGCDDGVVRLWDLRTDRHGQLPGHRGRVVVRGVSADGAVAATLAHDNQARIWDLAANNERRRIQPPIGPYAYCEGRLSRDGTRLGIATRADIAQIYDTATGDLLHEAPLRTQVDDMAMDPSGWRIAAGFTGGGVRLHDFRTSRTLDTDTSPGSNVMNVEFAPDGGTVLVCTQDGLMTLIDFETAGSVATFPKVPEWTERGVFTPDGEFLATAGWDGVARLWRVDGTQLIREFSGHDAWLTDTAFSASGRRLLTSSSDGTIRVWSIDDGIELLRIALGSGSADSLSVGPADSLVVATFRGRNPEVWRLPPTSGPGASAELAAWERERAARAIADAGRPATPEEDPLRELAQRHLPDVQGRLVPYRLSESGLERGRRLRVVILHPAPRDPSDPRAVFITGNRPELGTWTPNRVALHPVAEVPGGVLWEYETVFRPMEFKFSFATEGEPWGDSHEWGGPPNREIGLRRPLHIDGGGVLYYLAEYGVVPDSATPTRAPES
ncbi:MAG: protein kinase [Candidatus Sumerlaeia bacterium]|nr:protein kinase [Candidatus Sumerlaeia bacterium]